MVMSHTTITFNTQYSLLHRLVIAYKTNRYIDEEASCSQLGYIINFSKGSIGLSGVANAGTKES